ncbi:MAG: metal ABC transporter substrate-binding protein [Oscillospiraceae bacterium]|nr:metal ABC transporter substrate-binding protein [Oscillospiraceae bacterium]
MKKLWSLLLLTGAFLILAGCGAASTEQSGRSVAATTYPVAQFTAAICDGTDVTVSRIISDSVSCLHDYSLSVRQAEAVEQADVVICSGAGLEDFMEDVLKNKQTVIECSEGIPLRENEDRDEGEFDPHIWMAPENAAIMVQNIADGLAAVFPEDAKTFAQNAAALQQQLSALQAEGEALLSKLSCRELVTFHDGFGYFASAFDLTILAAIEEESGSEASAQDIRQIVELVTQNRIPAVFVEANGSDAAAKIIAGETGCAIGTLDMCLGDADYFAAMRANFDALGEALQ